MNQVKTPADISRLGTILGIWAHPDDETFCAAGIMKAATDNGQQVICVTATKGEAGSQDLERWPLKSLSKVRVDELKAALKIIGVKKLHFLGYKDGECSEKDSQPAIEQIQGYIEQYQPDTILTFGPDGLTGHPDHVTVSKWVNEAVIGSNKPKIYHAVITINQYQKYLSAADKKFDIFYNLPQPPLVEDDEPEINFCCTNELCNCKYSAFKTMPSQYEKLQASYDVQFLEEAFRIEAFTLNKEESKENSI